MTRTKGRAALLGTIVLLLLAAASVGRAGGAATKGHPAALYNLVANPRARVEVGTETHDVVARVAEGDERERIWSRQKERSPGFAEYERKTSRQIPVVILERVG